VIDASALKVASHRSDASEVVPASTVWRQGGASAHPGTMSRPEDPARPGPYPRAARSTAAGFPRSSPTIKSSCGGWCRRIRPNTNNLEWSEDPNGVG
jgi:hypothetical protein